MFWHLVSFVAQFMRYWNHTTGYEIRLRIVVCNRRIRSILFMYKEICGPPDEDATDYILNSDGSLLSTFIKVTISKQLLYCEFDDWGFYFMYSIIVIAEIGISVIVSLLIFHRIKLVHYNLHCIIYIFNKTIILSVQILGKSVMCILIVGM